uniref:PDZ domain-containing protein n=1 Tax=Hanusia phi TaxID=3032 RepID=A0A7S0DUS4_9CRYP
MKLIVLRKGAVVNVTIDEELFNITAVESRTVLSPVFRSKRLGLSMHVNTDDGSVKIVFVERDGPAGKTRMLQCDDEIVAVNGYPIAEKTLDKVPKLDDLMLMFETAIDQVTVLTIRRENVAEEFEVAILQSSGQSEDKKISSISFPRPPLLRSAGDEVVSNLSLGLVLLRRPQKSIGFEVYEVKKHRPAMEVGLRAGDVLVGVDGLNVNGMEATDVEALLEGPVGTSVLLTILRTGDPLRMIRLQRQPLKEEREQIACVQMLRPVFASGETGK